MPEAQSRCKILAGEPVVCLMCQVHGSSCVFPDASEITARSPQSARRRKQHTRLRHEPTPPQAPITASSPPPPCLRMEQTSDDNTVNRDVPFTESVPRPERAAQAAATPAQEDDEAHIVRPVHSPDALLIASFLTRAGASDARAVRSNPVPGERPVMLNAVRRHLLGRSASQSTAASRLEVIEKLLEPHASSLIDLYFKKIHKCYPLLDEAAFRTQYTTAKTKLSPALLASMYAHSRVYWKQTLLPGHHCPDVRYIWNQACEALYFELYQSPGLSAIVAILLNISGRLLSSMIGNATLHGAAISLAHCLGLNRNCLSWRLPEAEKAHRIRLWWAIVVYDKWSSVAYGTPPQLQSTRHDVPLPDRRMCALSSSRADTDQDISAAAVFVASVTLVDVDYVYLSHVFDLSASREGRQHEDAAFSTSMENKLAQWADTLPHDLCRTIIRGDKLDVPGSANLRLSYLYLRLLIHKLDLDVTTHSYLHQTLNAAASVQRQLRARQAAEDIVIFVQELDEGALTDFWQSFNAFALSSTAGFLLSSALKEMQQNTSSVDHRSTTSRRSTASFQQTESRHNDNARGSISIKLATDLITALETHRKSAGWDLANICIAQYARVVVQIQQGLDPTLAGPILATTPGQHKHGGPADGEDAVSQNTDGRVQQDQHPLF
ncbi:fungal-specific transcription factor domain-domain-containing protein, partial [Microdochium bolleyi]